MFSIKGRSSISALWKSLMPIGMLLVIVGMACGDSEPEADPTATSEAPSSAATPTTAPDSATPTTVVPDSETPPAASGERFVVGSELVIAPLFVHALNGLGQASQTAGWGIGENLLRVDEEGNLDPSKSMAESWVVAEDASTITFTIREGVAFHDGYGDWGNVDAYDVAWSFNNAMREGSVFHRVTSLQPFMDRWEATDERTVVLHWKEGEFLPWWDTNFSQVARADPWITSKKIVDEMGEEEANLIPVGTGPFKVLSWTPGDNIELEAVADHWRQTPAVAGYDVVEIREPLAMASAFRTGEIDFAPLPNSMIPDVTGDVVGSWTQAIGPPNAQCVNFTGNYWAMENPETGEQLFPRPAFDPELPWIGDPRDPESMERARKVRLALALAIDRDAILEEIFAGFGFTQAVATTSFGPNDPWWNPEWEFHYDVDRAKQLMEEAGYADGFTIPFYVPPQHPRVSEEAGQAVAEFWRELNVDTQIDSTAWAAYRPKRFDGVDNVPWYHCGGIYDSPDRPKGDGIESTYRGYELPEDMWHLFYDNFSEPDRSKRIENNVTLANYVVRDWVLQVNFSVVESNIVARPEVTSWEPHAYDNPGAFIAPETVVIER